jgi:CBS domain-containing protein
MSRVSDLLARKSPHVHSVRPDDNVRHAIRRMIDENVGALLVIEEDNIRGIFTERDVLRRVALAGRDPRVMHVSEVMTADPITIDPDSSVESCMERMTRERIRHLPVVAKGVLVGILSIGDLLKYASEARAVEVEHLTRYIHGAEPPAREAG